MSISKEEKQTCIKEFGRSDSDSGSPEVQVAILTNRIKNLHNNHLSQHKKDIHSRHGLMKLVVRRKKLLAFLKRQDIMKYKDVISRLGLRK